MLLGEDQGSPSPEKQAAAGRSLEDGRRKPLERYDVARGGESTAGELVDAENRTWLENSAAEMARQLDELEADIPPEELKAWKEAFAQAVKLVRYVPGKGFLAKEARL